MIISELDQVKDAIQFYDRINKVASTQIILGIKSFPTSRKFIELPGIKSFFYFKWDSTSCLKICPESPLSFSLEHKKFELILNNLNEKILEVTQDKKIKMYWESIIHRAQDDVIKGFGRLIKE